MRVLVYPLVLVKHGFVPNKKVLLKVNVLLLPALGLSPVQWKSLRPSESLSVLILMLLTQALIMFVAPLLLVVMRPHKKPHPALHKT